MSERPSKVIEPCDGCTLPVVAGDRPLGRLLRDAKLYEIGAGKVLAGLAKRIVPTLNAFSIGTPLTRAARSGGWCCSTL